MDIGMVVATKNEMLALIEALPAPQWAGEVNGFTVRTFRVGENNIHAVESGAGEIQAAAATQFLITGCLTHLIANFGVCGGLTQNIPLAQPVVVSAAVHYDRDISAVDGCEPERYEQCDGIYIKTSKELVDVAVKAEPGLHRVICASGDKFLANPDMKKMQFKKYGAEICDMEAAGILLTAKRAGVPVLMIKAVSDSSEGGADEYWNTVSVAAKSCVDTLLKVVKELEVKK